YAFYDNGTGGGHFDIVGEVQPAEEFFYVEASALATVQYVGGATDGVETLSIAVSDGKEFSAVGSLTATTGAVAPAPPPPPGSPPPPDPNRPPVVKTRDISVAAGQSVSGASLISSVIDPDADPILLYAFYYAGKNDGYFAVNGEKKPNGYGTVVAPADIGTVQYFGATTAGTDLVGVQAFDGTDWSLSGAVIATTTGSISPPPASSPPASPITTPATAPASPPSPLPPPSPPPPTTVAAALPGGGTINVEFDSAVRGAKGQSLIDRVNDGVRAGTISVATVASGGAAPAVPGGKSGEMLVHNVGTYTMANGYLTALIDAPARVTLSGGAAAGQLVMAGLGGLAFNGGPGTGTVMAGGGDNLVSMYPEAGAGSQHVDLGSGNDTVIGLAGNNTISAGLGRNQILLGSGANQVISTGDDLIAGGNGTATISSGGNAPVVYLGTGRSVFNGGGGRATVVGGGGTATINSPGNSQLWLGSNTDVVNSSGADTVIARTGAATVNAAAGNMFVFAGSGALDFHMGVGISTVLGASGPVILRGGVGSVIALAYAPMRYIGDQGADTIAAFGTASALNAVGGSGRALFLGGPSGHNSITGGTGTSIMFGGGDGDVLTAGTGAGDTIKGGTGAETISAAGTRGIHKFYAGSGPNLIRTGDNNTSVLLSTGAATIVAGAGIDLYAFTSGNHPDVLIQNFKSGSDYLSLIGFAAGEAGNAIARSSTSGGSQSLTLTDGTHITFQNFTGLGVGNFL
ncbi:MAG: hypothetical protein H7251_09060, partial [Acetobacteraceae bacterium]|nr:hypothetical protein [Acetobacteraceae bacterium]